MANLFTRPDTFFGVCEALRQDLGVNPIWFRLSFGVALLWQPVAVIAAYFTVGAAVLALRLLMPDAKPVDAAPVAAIEGANDAETPVLAKAA